MFEIINPRDHTMKFGILHPFFDKLFWLLNSLTLFEWFKRAGALICQKLSGSSIHKVAYKRTAGDIYILFKWGFVIWLLESSINNSFATSIVWYLIYTNIYTFFYSMIWKIQNHTMDSRWARRRFLNLLQAIAFSFVAFAYLYYIPYATDMYWDKTPHTYLHAFWYSISNSVAGNYDRIKPLSTWGDSVSMIQFLIMFIFAAIIISKAIPDDGQPDLTNDITLRDTTLTSTES